MSTSGGSFAEELGLSRTGDAQERCFRLCSNHCVFCFIDQLPSGLRSSLYVKDGDYRLSPLFGNFVTLTNVSRGELKKIVDLKMSPMFVSVHCTDPSRRRDLLKHRAAGRILEQVDFLTRGGVEVHAQIVVCPGWNDGTVLEGTLNDLLTLSVPPLSVAVVPVGLTDHRQGLTPLDSVDRSLARETLDLLRGVQKRCRRSLGRNWVYGADELYILANLPFPDVQDYDGLWQEENGVGRVRLFLNDARKEMKIRRPVASSGRRVVATGRDFAPILAGLLAPWVSADSVRVLPIPSRLFGKGVSVAGLMSGGDILACREAVCGAERLFIPNSCLREERPRLFLDDWGPGSLSRELGLPIHSVSPSGDALIRVLSGQDEGDGT